MGHDTTIIRKFLESLAGYPMQSRLDDMLFDFVLVDGEERSERIKSWFANQNLSYVVKDAADSNGLRSCRVLFEDRHLAMLFKLSFKSC